MNENQTTIQMLKILAKNNNKKKSRKVKKTHVKTIYPRGIENRYKNLLSGYFKPLIDYTNKFIKEHSEELLKGDSVDVRLDSVPGETYRQLVKNMNTWVNTYFPDKVDVDNGVISNAYIGIKKTAEDLKTFEDKEFEKQIEKAINVNIKESSDWWEGMVDSWSETNYQLIKSNASQYVSKINTIVEQAVVNGTTVRELKESIQKATQNLSDYKCTLLARDQIGKLQGQISQSQMEEIGLEMYIWSTSNDDRVRDSHAIMEGLLCRWDNASVYSEDGGKTWIDRPGGAIDMHPGQDIQCRCVALAYFPELESEVFGTPMEYIEGKEVETVKEFNESDYVSSLNYQNELTNDYNKFFEKLGVDVKNIPEHLGNQYQRRQWLKQNLNSELLSIYEYSDTEFIHINQALNNENPMTDNILQKIKNMDSVIKKSPPLKNNMIFYRGEEGIRHENWKVGDVVTSPIFSSTSINEKDISGFIAGRDLIEFYAPKGSKCGTYINSISSYDGEEKEFLMKRNLKFKIISFEKDKTDQRIWKCLILD